MMNEKITIIELSINQEDKYKIYVKEHRNSMLYHTLHYRNFIIKLLNAIPKYFLAIDEQDNIVGILPLMSKEGSLGVVYNSLPFYGSNGAILANNQNVFDSLLTFYNEFTSNENVASATLITSPLSTDNYKEKTNYTFEDYRIGQLTHLPASMNEEDLMTIYHYKTRNMVRKALKENIEVHIDNSAESIYFTKETHKQNMQAIGGKPKSDMFFELFPKYFEAGKDFNIYVATIDRQKIASMLLFYHNQTIEYYTPVIVAEFREKQPLSRLIFQAMLDGMRNGYNLWNWGGTWATQDGVYHFKSRWGTTDVNYFYYTKINNTAIIHADKSVLLTEYENFFAIPFQFIQPK